MPCAARISPCPKSGPRNRSDKMLDMQARDLPGDLQRKLTAFFDFQHQQQRHDTGFITQSLPHTTRVALSQHLYGGVLHRNRFLFRNLNRQFTTMMLMELSEEFLMPGGVVFVMGDMARDLYFVVNGVVERKKEDKVCALGRSPFRFHKPPGSERAAHLLSRRSLHLFMENRRAPTSWGRWRLFCLSPTHTRRKPACRALQHCSV